MSKRSEVPADRRFALLELVHNLSLAADVEGTLSALLDAGVGLVPCDAMSVMWLDDERLRVLARSAAPAAPVGLTLPCSQMGAARPAVDTGRCVVVSDTAEDVRWSPIPGEESVRSWLGAPLLVEGRVVGLLEWTARQPAWFGEQALPAAVDTATHAAPLLYRAQLLEELRWRLREQVVGSSRPSLPRVDLDTELEEVVTEAREYTDSRSAFLFLLDEEDGSLRCAAASGEQRERLKYAVLQGDGTLGGWKVPREPSGRRRGGKHADRDVMGALGIDRPLILALRLKGRLAGMLGVAGPPGDQPYGPDAVRLMTHLASQAAVGLDRSTAARPEPLRCDFEMVVQSAPLGVAVLSLSGDILLCNSELCELTSRSSRSLVGHSFASLATAGDSRRLENALEEVVLRGQRRQVDVGLRTGLGELRQVRVWLVLARVTDDTAGNLVAMVENITSLKILEQERVQHLRELREKHSQLRELDQLKSRFVSNVSHELRTPLALIKLFATLARRGRPEKQAHYLQTIEQETLRLEMMVENVLDLSRLDRHALRTHPEWLAVDDVIAQVLEVYAETAARKGLELQNLVPAGLAPLWADKDHLVQMLTNLVDNALKYTPRGGRVWVEARPAESEGRRGLEIDVGDTGIGIAEEEQEQVFERFFRGSNNTASSSGTGLGLPIVRDLMANHGGTITLRSRAGEGSVLTLHFPLGQPQAEQAA